MKSLVDIYENMIDDEILEARASLLKRVKQKALKKAKILKNKQKKFWKDAFSD